MKLTIGSLHPGSHTTDDALLDQLQELSQKLDEETDQLLDSISADVEDKEEKEESTEPGKHFGVVYARDLDTGRVIGYLKYIPSESVFRIEELYVDKNFRRKCIGYSLMKEFYKICRERNALKINLGCVAANSEGMAFYASEGYKISDATYILAGNEKDVKRLPIRCREFDEASWNRIWNEMTLYLDKSVNLPEEIEMVREWYDNRKMFRPFSICSFEKFECVVFAHCRDSELYIPAFNMNPDDLNKDILDELASTLLQYVKKMKMKQVCIADIHLPANLDKISDQWKKIGCTCYKMASDLKPQVSNLKI